MEKERKRTTAAREILHQRLYADRPDRIEGLEQTKREMTLGLKIRRLREEANLTQQQLADMINTQPSAISRIEDADYDGHSLTLLKRVADALGMLLIIDFVAKPEPDGRNSRIN